MTIVASLLVLALLVGLGAVAILAIRSRWLASGDDRGDWEKTLVECKNLRDEGVLTEEEYRKIRTLVEPRMRIGLPDVSGRHLPAVDPAGPDHERT